MTRLGRGLRAVALAAALAVSATGCSGEDPVIDIPIGEETTPPATSGDAPSPTASDGTPDEDAGPTGPDGEPIDDEATPSDAVTSEPTPTGPDTPVADGGAVGANGRAMLRGDRPRLVIEVDVQEGAQVDQAALDHLVDEVSKYVDKPEGIAFVGGNTFATDRQQWTADDLRAAAAEHRSTFSDDTQVSVHVMYVRGSHVRDGEETNAIGLAYSASTIALFPDKWSGFGALLGSTRAVERAVLVHELGHLFGLVNLTYDSDIDHEDPGHPGHSSNRESVMYYAIETTLIQQVFSGPPPDRFDDADASDLEGLKSGRL